jgi:hypothetical protein
VALGPTCQLATSVHSSFSDHPTHPRGLLYLILYPGGLLLPFVISDMTPSSTRATNDDAHHQGGVRGAIRRAKFFFQSLSSSRARAVPLLFPHWPVTDEARRVCVCRLQPRRSSISRELPPTLHALVSGGWSLWSSRAPVAAAADLHHTPAAPCSPRGGWRLSG